MMCQASRIGERKQDGVALRAFDDRPVESRWSASVTIKPYRRQHPETTGRS